MTSGRRGRGGRRGMEQEAQRHSGGRGGEDIGVRRSQEGDSVPFTGTAWRREPPLAGGWLPSGVLVTPGSLRRCGRHPPPSGDPPLRERGFVVGVGGCWRGPSPPAPSPHPRRGGNSRCGAAGCSVGGRHRAHDGTATLCSPPCSARPVRLRALCARCACVLCGYRPFSFAYSPLTSRRSGPASPRPVPRRGRASGGRPCSRPPGRA